EFCMSSFVEDEAGIRGRTGTEVQRCPLPSSGANAAISTVTGTSWNVGHGYVTRLSPTLTANPGESAHTVNCGADDALPSFHTHSPVSTALPNDTTPPLLNGANSKPTPAPTGGNDDSRHAEYR